jgi:ATP-binding cassette subfamily C (CFTR/MRP) protein 4
VDLVFSKGKQKGTVIASLKKEIMRECTVSVPPEHVSEKTPMAQANILSRITWNWMTSIVNAGYEKSLEMTDLPLLGKVDSAKYLFDQAIEHWSGGARRVFKITPLLKKGFLKIFLLNGLMELTYMALQIASWLLLKELILFLSGGQTNLGIAYLSASLLGISGILQAFVHHGYFFGANRIGAQVRTLMNTVIFDKLLRLKQSALIETTTGQIVNLVTNDSFKMEMAATYTFFLIAGPIVGIVVMILLYQELGVASFAACATTFAMVPLQSFFSGRFASIRKKTMEFTDQRVKIIKEILVGSQIVKMYNW